MNRRGFFSRLGLVTAAFAILPSATTYARIWKSTHGLYVPETPDVPFDPREYFGTWKFVIFDEKWKSRFDPKAPRLEIIGRIDSIAALP